MSDVYEFYSPFAHMPGRYEWARIHSPTHDSFDCFIVLHDGTDKPVTVYVNSDQGEAFMADRFPESKCIRVPQPALSVSSDPWSNRVEGRLASRKGPVQTVEMLFSRANRRLPRSVPYGGTGRVWGSRFSCEGVDLEVDATVQGRIVTPNRTETLADERGIITLGSYGRLWESEG